MLASLPMVYVGSLKDRHGPRRVLAGVVALFGLTCVGVSQVSGLFTVFISFLFRRMLAQGSMGMLTMNAVAMWFNWRLGDGHRHRQHRLGPVHGHDPRVESLVDTG